LRDFAVGAGGAEEGDAAADAVDGRLQQARGLRDEGGDGDGGEEDEAETREGEAFGVDAGGWVRLCLAGFLLFVMRGETYTPSSWRRWRMVCLASRALFSALSLDEDMVDGL